jgi:DNA-binding NarL/FixJ family response regulator
MTRVLVLAPTPAARTGLESLLAREPALVVFGSAAPPERLAEVLETVQADVALLALAPGAEPPALAPGSGPDGSARAPAVVLLGGGPEDEGAGRDGWTARALRLGARGVLPRAPEPAELVAAIAAAAAGLLVVPAERGGTLAARRSRARESGGAADTAVPILTPREADVLALLGEGLGNKAIAARLGISPHTVKTHMAALFAKLGAGTRAEALGRAARMGLLML